MGWWRVAPGKWLLFYAPGGPFPKRPGARWLPDDDPTIGWDRPRPIYPEVEPVDEHKLAIDIVATRGAIRGFEYMIATVPPASHRAYVSCIRDRLYREFGRKFMIRKLGPDYTHASEEIVNKPWFNARDYGNSPTRWAMKALVTGDTDYVVLGGDYRR